ncbi:DUF72 domain-containing protein [Angustibacter sp. McL0619]|uniref:DUF72 domain-containing protein n=1 Tax=Angustibacter sp. McL0619 TaxID=3415676 RepID=UPI003CEEDDED
MTTERAELTAPTARVGIAGWTYPAWRGDFYPAGLAHRRELEYASSKLSTIEVNGTFYAMQKPASFRSWAEQTPDDFVFSLKGGRFITHMKRLRDVEVAVANYFATGPLALGPKLGAVLWQLPPNFAFDADLVRAFLRLLPQDTVQAEALAARHDERVPEPASAVGPPRRVRHAVEARHPSFGSAESVRLMREHGVALVVADSAKHWPMLEEATADFVYARLHGDIELYASGYSASALDVWAQRVRGWLAEGLDVLLYFDNDAKGYAPHDAMALAERLSPTG